MRLLVTGAKGLLGQEVTRLAAEAGHAVVDCDRRRLDVTDAAAVRATLERERPEAVVHCAAFCDVDGAEGREAEALRVNGAGAGTVARAAAAVGARLVHLSSDYVFPGAERRPRREDDPLGPLGAYGRSKLAGEEAVLGAGGNAVVVRSAWLYGAGGRNFVDSIRARARAADGPLRVVDDQVGSPTWSVSLAEALLALLAVEHRGVVHVANRGAVSWYDVATAVIEEMGLATVVERIDSATLGRPAPRPPYSALDTARFEELAGWAPSPWRRALHLYLTGSRHDRSSSERRGASA
jgi:dTDP-4-dehydrorhamnose reductase